MFVPFAVCPALSRCIVAANRKYADWTQNDPEHLAVKSTLYTLNTYPDAQFLVDTPLRPVLFEVQDCRKLQMQRKISELHVPILNTCLLKVPSIN